ncbi:ATP11 protein (macronuclear) [Tetrahymena thermophila SB210]|uniref:ATP11 protein n=1 Tax=Tetrahymena thermophila (strain SB210) TaxID=312017 RepID=I7M466_TETTS|nr:ATP11 protein [Tetrahymena thermophila SB210]EAS04996.1 ATP11 protein [Tetrahymena thermophila SB210]|eukprot:XP_001025241.1 ATP11 protein [Tetrahymena thermophila SB210]
MKRLTHLAQYHFSFNYPCPRKLREVVKLSLFEKETTDKCIDLWTEYHNTRSENISDAISKKEYDILKRQYTQSPMFLVPIKKKTGHFLLLGQAQEKSILFTYLEDYKLKGTKATPYFVITLFDELIPTKQLSLVRGDIINFMITKPEANVVWNLTLKQYLTPDLYQDFVFKFNHSPHEFNYEAYSQFFQLQI